MIWIKRYYGAFAYFYEKRLKSLFLYNIDQFRFADLIFFASMYLALGNLLYIFMRLNNVSRVSWMKCNSILILLTIFIFTVTPKFPSLYFFKDDAEFDAFIEDKVFLNFRKYSWALFFLLVGLFVFL